MGPRTQSEPVRVLVVGSDPLARSSLAALLGSDPDFALVGEESGAAPLSKDSARAQVLIWDLGLEPRQALDRLRGEHPSTPAVALVPDEATAAQAIAAGASGVLFRYLDRARLFAALRAVIQGLAVLEEPMGRSLLRARFEPRPLTEEPLTAREREVLQLLSQGLSNKEIAQRLGISAHTARFHVNAILAKLGAQSRTEAVVQAARRGLVVL
jgi:DNA-binding NarL/FixJ family response regulator